MQLIPSCPDRSLSTWPCAEEIRDLLSKEYTKRLELKESPDKGVYVKDLIQFVAKGVGELNNVLKWVTAISMHACHALCKARRKCQLGT